MTIDLDKARAELPILRDFIDFVNNQVGVYMDCLAGFQGNAVKFTARLPECSDPLAVRSRIVSR